MQAPCLGGFFAVIALSSHSKVNKLNVICIFITTSNINKQWLVLVCNYYTECLEDFRLELLMIVRFL